MLQSQGFAKWLLARREAEGLTQQELAVRAGCKKAYISKLENTSRPVGQKPPAPTLEFLVKLARAFGAPVSEPLIALGYLKEDSQIHIEPHIMRMIHYYRELPEREQRLAEEIIKTLWRETSKFASAEIPKKKRA